MDMSRHLKLNLLENGIDSLKEGIRYFLRGAHDPGRYKFAILLLFHGVELILKERLAKNHRILIYANLDRPIGDSSKTVTFDGLLIRLQNSGVSIEKDLLSAFSDLEELRNRVQHSVVSLREDFVRDVIGRTCKHLIEFMQKELDVELDQHLSDTDYKVLVEAIDYYEERLRIALAEIKKLTTRVYKDDPDYEVHFCPECGEECVATRDMDRDEFVECHFCHARHFVACCPRCGRIELMHDVPDPEDGLLCSDCWDELMSED